MPASKKSRRVAGIEHQQYPLGKAEAQLETIAPMQVGARDANGSAGPLPDEFSSDPMRALLEAVPDAILTVDGAGQIGLVNQQTERLFGYRREDLVGQSLERLLPERLRGKHSEHRQEYVAHPRTRPMGIGQELVGRRQDGSEFPVEVSLSPVTTPTGSVTICTVRDISERKRADDEIRRLNAELEGRVRERTAQLEATNRELQTEIRERAQVQDSLRAAQSELQLITDTMAAGVTHCSRDLQYQWVNPRYASWLGRKPEEIAHHPIAEIIGEEGYAAIRPHIERVLAGQRVEYEAEVNFQGPGLRWIHAVYEPTFDAAGVTEGWVAVVADITERKRTEEALAVASRRMAADLDAMSRLHRIGALFVRQDGLQPVLDEVVQAAIVITQADMGNLQLLDPATNSLKIVAHHGFEPDWLNYWDTVSEGQGTCGTALERGERVIVEDVTTSPLFVNTPALEVQLAAGVWAVQSTPIVSREGRPLGMFSTHFRRSHRPNERALRLLDLLARQTADILERFRAEEAIRHLNRDLEQRATDLEVANQELESFSYSVSHDLRMPLASIENLVQILRQDQRPALSAWGQRVLDLIGAQARSMDQLIQSLLKFSRLSRQPIKKQAVEPEALVRSVLEQLRPEQNGREIEFIIGDLPVCHADPILLQQVFANLLSNAIKYSRGRTPARIQVGGEPKSTEQVYWVKDNGIGFSMEDADKLFGVFQRLHAAEDFEGTGVGLAIVQRIIHRHGGRVWAEAEVDQGATFHFTVPSEWPGGPAFGVRP